MALLVGVGLCLLACAGETEDPATESVEADVIAPDGGSEPAAPVGEEPTAEPTAEPAVEPVTEPVAEPAAEPSAVCPPDFVDVSLVSGQHEGFLSAEQQRSFYLRLPDASVHSPPFPLLVDFHGTNGTGANSYATHNLDDFLNKGFAVLALDGEENGFIWPVWDAMRNADEQDLPNPDLEFFDDALACVSAHVSIDANRVYLAGKSAGGIMTNYVLQRRSGVVAGGIVSSGIYEFTAPIPTLDLAPFAVIVTWGGDNDKWEGQAGDGPTANVSFAEQAAVASQFYEGTEGINQVYCKGPELGHAWLSTVNGWMADFLLAHPLGQAQNDDYVFEAPQDVGGVICSDEAAEYVSEVVVACEPGVLEHCQTYCQFLGDCVVSNGTVAPVLTPQLDALGFSGEDYAECGGCVEACEADAESGADADTQTLACFAESFAVAECGGGLPGSMPFVDAVNACCADGADSMVCGRLCGTILDNDVVVQTQLFGVCELWSAAP